MKVMIIAALCAAGLLAAGSASAEVVSVSVTGEFWSSVTGPSGWYTGYVGPLGGGGPFDAVIEEDNTPGPGQETVLWEVEGGVLFNLNLSFDDGGVTPSATPIHATILSGNITVDHYSADLTGLSLEFQTDASGLLPFDLSFSGDGVSGGAFNGSGTAIVGYRDANFSEGASEVFGGSFTIGVPEPATWALMIAGLGLAGAGLRRKRAAALR